MYRRMWVAALVTLTGCGIEDVSVNGGSNLGSTTAKNPDEGRELLKQFGMPFRDDTKKEDGRR